MDNVLHEGKTIREWAAIIRDLDSCDDAISREAAVHACTNGWNKDYKEIMADIRALPPVHPKQTECEDAISRQAVWDVMQELWGTNGELMDRLMALPPVTPAEKEGRWEWVQYDGNPNIGNWHCTECDRIVCGAITAANPVYAYKYCPNCGAKMQEVTDEID